MMNQLTTKIRKQRVLNLYKSISGWLMDCGTVDRVFVYSYLKAISWNLACRLQHTADIIFKDISWSTCFDAFSKTFVNSKID